MASREAMLSTIVQLMEARTEGKLDAIGQLIAPNAKYELVGEQSLMGRFPVGPGDARDAVVTLIDLIAYHHFHIVEAICDGDKAMTLMDVDASVGGDAPERMRIGGLWTFDAEGRPKSLIEFTDTARLAQRISAGPMVTTTLVSE